MGKEVAVKKKVTSFFIMYLLLFYLTSYSIHGASTYFSFVYWFMILLDHCFTFEMSI